MSKSKKIILISTNNLKDPYPVYPLGLSYIATFLQNKLPELDAKILDLNINKIDTLAETIKQERPDYIGLSIRNIDNVNYMKQEAFVNHYKSLIDIIRKNSAAPVIIGGAGYSIYPQTLFQHLNPDFGIWGEGENSFYQLINSLENNTDTSQIEGLIYKKDNEIILNDRANFIYDIDVNYDDGLLNYYWDKSGMLNLQTKRGCPHNCIYCTYPLIEGRQVRTLNQDKIINVLKKLKHEKNVSYVFFTDSLFNIHKEYNEQLAHKLIESDVGINWGAYFAPNKDLSSETLELYKKSGLQHVEFGTESISDTVLKSYQKNFSVEDIIESSKRCNELDIHFAHFLILGGYGETNETYHETLENSKKIDNSVFFPYVGMRIYPGTPLYDIALREGVVQPEELLLEPKYYISKNVDFSNLAADVEATGQSWVLPNRDHATAIAKIREKRKVSGPLWELLI